jgi:hypothetical protein
VLTPALPPRPAKSLQQQPAWQRITHTFDHLLRPKPPMASVEERIQWVLSKIDWTNPRIVIWGPGTSEYWIKEPFDDAVHAFAPNQHIAMIPYESTWLFSESVPDGVAVLTGVLKAIHRIDPSRKVLLAGESQGAWIVGNVLADKSVSGMIERASLWGHPGAAKHYPGHVPHSPAKPLNYTPDGRVREVDNASDVVTAPLGDQTDQVMGAVEAFARRQFVPAIEVFAHYAVENPGVVKELLRSQLWRLPGFASKDGANPHDYDADMVRGVRFLITGQRADG